MFLTKWVAWGRLGPMRESVASIVRRNAFRFAMTGIVGIWLSGCADATRFADSGNPFSNPFASAPSADAGAPTPRVSSTPLASAQPYKRSYAADARPSPSVSAAAPIPAPEATGSIRPRARTGRRVVGGLDGGRRLAGHRRRRRRVARRCRAATACRNLRCSAPTACSRARRSRQHAHRHPRL